jgi:hypothetical protein
VALVGDNPTCSICGHAIGPGETTVATTHFIDDEAHPLWKYSDSIMHRECFLTWPHRKGFVFLHNSVFTPRPGVETVSRYLFQDGETFRRHFPSGKLYAWTTPLAAIQQDQQSRNP